eukprot:2417820-Rhodomonas_salina.2
MHGDTHRGHGVPAHPESTSVPCSECCRAQHLRDRDGDHWICTRGPVGDKSPTPWGTRTEERTHPQTSGSGCSEGPDRVMIPASLTCTGASQLPA